MQQPSQLQLSQPQPQMQLSQPSQSQLQLSQPSQLQLSQLSQPLQSQLSQPLQSQLSQPQPSYLQPSYMQPSQFDLNIPNDISTSHTAIMVLRYSTNAPDLLFKDDVNHYNESSTTHEISYDAPQPEQKFPNAFKVNNEYYVPSVSMAGMRPNTFSASNVLLCQYDAMDTAIFIKKQSNEIGAPSRLLLHNFANNTAPCGGLWDSNSPENQVYRRTNIGELILPIQYKLYPIQNEKKDHVGNYSINMIIAEHCTLFKTGDGKQLSAPLTLDIASIDALMTPTEKNLDLYSTDALARCDYANIEDKANMEQRIQFILNYALGENYDYLITGAWGADNYNPLWGLINLWNNAIMMLPATNLKIIFCIPVLDDPHSDNIFVYKHFSKYLIGQANKANINFHQLADEQKIKADLEKISEDENRIKKRIYGLVWGAAMGEMLGGYISRQKTASVAATAAADATAADADAADAAATTWTITNGEETLDWDMCTDMLILVMRMLSTCQMDVQPKVLAKNLIIWKNNGLNGRPTTCSDQCTRHILSQSDYAEHFFEVAAHVHGARGINDATSSVFGCNLLNGIFKDYVRRTMLCCNLLQPNAMSQVSNIVYSYIINCIWNGKFITTRDWSTLFGVCNKILDANKQTATQNRLDFNTYLSVGQNYQYNIKSGIKEYVTRNSNVGPLKNVDNALVPMTLAIILMYDIMGQVLIDGKPSHTMMNALDIPVLDEKMQDKKINYSDYLPETYYFQTIQDLASINSNVVCCAVVGAVAGLACWNNVYDDEVKRDLYGNKIETNSQQWIKYAEYANWLNHEINQFVGKYLELRRGALQSRLARTSSSRPFSAQQHSPYY